MTWVTAHSYDVGLLIAVVFLRILKSRIQPLSCRAMPAFRHSSERIGETCAMQYYYYYYYYYYYD